MQAYRALEDFDAAWQKVASGAAPPRLEAVLQSIPQAERPVYLRELLAIDLEYRSKRGESPRVDDYVQLLAADPDMIQSVFADCGIASPDEPGADEAADDSRGAPGAGPRLASPEAYLSLKAGTEIGNYSIIRLIGQGGMGAVYQAEHRRMRRKVALKMISPAALKHPEALQRFHREAEAMARLEHPNIVTAHDADQAGDIHFLVMQFVDGEDLSTMVKTRGPLELGTALRYLVQTALGLEYAHQEGVIHRDIKPSNLIVNRSGTVKILDMGLARLEDSLSEASPDNRNLTQAGNLMGTVDYMAPEQALDAKEADQRADIYSLGCTFYYTVTGQKLYGGDTPMKRIMAHRFEPIPSLRVARPDVPAELDSVFQKMVAKNRADRYPSMTELLTALAPFSVSGLPGADSAEHSPGRQSYSADHLHPRPAAVSPSKVLGAQPLAPDTTAEQTSPSSISDTQIKPHLGGKPAPAKEKPVARSGAAVPHRPISVPSAAHEPVTTSENMSWRARASK
ncbi:MAG TPA: serine/threonine-protein kinase, partial [Planctomycetaceae bacterium]